LNDKKLTVSSEGETINAVLATDNSSNIESRIKNFEILSRVYAEVRHIRIFVAGAIHLAKIASGQIDAYYKTKANYWDFAAGELLIQEAGGVVSDFQGNPFNQSSIDIIASNKLINDKIVELLNRQKSD